MICIAITSILTIHFLSFLRSSSSKLVKAIFVLSTIENHALWGHKSLLVDAMAYSFKNPYFKLIEQHNNIQGNRIS